MPDPELWTNEHFQRVLKNLVHSLVDAENQLYGLQDRRQRLESNRSEGKVPSGLKKLSTIDHRVSQSHGKPDPVWWS